MQIDLYHKNLENGNKNCLSSLSGHLLKVKTGRVKNTLQSDVQVRIRVLRWEDVPAVTSVSCVHGRPLRRQSSLQISTSQKHVQALIGAAKVNK